MKNKSIRCPFDNPESAIGKKVYKPSGKPFKSGLKANTVKALTINPMTQNTAFLFEEDDSFVDVNFCKIFLDVADLRIFENSA